MKVLLSGNEAVARGAYEFGIRVALGYPGTPSTEILENIVRFPEIYSQWSPNEKVALEMGIGASLAGARTLVTMKHVGLNVAADPLMTLAYTGVNAGLVIITADDPGMHSSQNEQDNRFFARFAQIPLLEPADSQEAKDLIGFGLKLSEEYDTPVLLRLTTRISHSKSLTDVIDQRIIPARQPFSKDPEKYVMIPAYSRKRHTLVKRRTESLRELSENTPWNRCERNDLAVSGQKIGIITGGVAYQYSREILPHASFLKLGMSFPLPEKLIADFASKVEKLYVVEELSPFIEEQVQAMGIPVEGRSILPDTGELTPEIIARAFLKCSPQTGLPGQRVSLPQRGKDKGEGGEGNRGAFLSSSQGSQADSAIPCQRVSLPQEGDENQEPCRETFNPGMPLAPRPPAMCPGCPHRSMFYTLARKKIRVMGDIGCYALAVFPPLESIDMCICMGASIGAAHGFNKAIEGSDTQPMVGVIGDSTFLHSGMTGLLDVAYNQGNTTIIILDNRTTAMTGFQHHAGTGRTLRGQKTRAVDLVALARAMGIDRVSVVDPYDLAQLGKVIDQEIRAPEPSLIISRRPCVLLDRNARRIQRQVDQEICTGCKMCLKLGCPAMRSSSEGKVIGGKVIGGKVIIDSLLCNGCPVCEQVCKTGAIKPVTPADQSARERPLINQQESAR
jgi:indolepyruvate ferredoxin oxidoreductase alpha subunit